MIRHRIAAGAAWPDLAPLVEQALTGEATLVVATSGSSGTPKQVELSGPALRASGEATAGVLGGHGRWVLALPTHHVAGLQVVARSVLAGTSPVTLPEGMPFRADFFRRAVAEAGEGGRPVLASLVPTQLHRLVGDEADGHAALREIDAILLGGAAADPGLLARARELGGRVVTTYGMSETCGGCVYDGVPLPGVRVRLTDEDRIHLGGPVLAEGYLDQPGLTAERFVEDADGRWFVTDDRGTWQDGRLRVLGRVDDVIVTGGHKVEPRDVEAALRTVPGIGDALVLGLPDEEWGQRVAALLVPTGTPLDLPALRDALPSTLPAHAAPRQIGWSDGIPLLASGKPDRAAASALLAGWQNGPSGQHP